MRPVLVTVMVTNIALFILYELLSYQVIDTNVKRTRDWSIVLSVVLLWLNTGVLAVKMHAQRLKPAPVYDHKNVARSLLEYVSVLSDSLWQVVTGPLVLWYEIDATRRVLGVCTVAGLVIFVLSASVMENPIAWRWGLFISIYLLTASSYGFVGYFAAYSLERRAPEMTPTVVLSGNGGKIDIVDLPTIDLTWWFLLAAPIHSLVLGHRRLHARWRDHLARVFQSRAMH